MHVYEENGIVYNFVSQLNQFYPLYDFNLQVGDTFQTYVNGAFGDPGMVRLRITGTSTDTINGVSLKKMTTTLLMGSYTFSTTDNDTILERIGGSYLFFQYLLCEAAPHQLRCYEDSLLGFYSTNIAPLCDYIYNSVQEIDPNDANNLMVIPNPTSTTITLSLPSNQIAMLSIFNLLGEKVREEKVTGKQVTMDVSSLPKGLYLVRIENRIVGKFVKK